MDFISNSETQVSEMLDTLGIKDVMELFQGIPNSLLCLAPDQDDGMSEYEGLKLMEGIGKQNTFLDYSSYIGGGAYEHHVPAIVPMVCAKSEFLTAYTPYQAEASQGMLQAIFEFQSAVCALTGMEVANASVYDGASACSEAALMALRHFRKKRTKIFLAGSLHPHYYQVVQQYLAHQDVEIVRIPFSKDGSLDKKWCEANVDTSTAAIIVQSPNFFGVMEDVKPIAELAKANGALTVLCANPMSYGLFASAGELGVDIAVGDMQSFGVPLQFGGPYAGYMACSNSLVRQLPARIVGQTTDTDKKIGYVLTLQAREQHIRREKATSNICTSQTLVSLASLIAILWYGKKGVQDLALTNYQRASFLKERLEAIPGISSLGSAPFFNEFTVKVNKPMNEVLAAFKEQGIVAGLPLGKYYPEMQDHLLIAVTETKSKEQLEKYLSLAGEILS
ncbi:MAG: glycine dehydrogenase subunit 1 [Chlamydiales bacterium]|jgi:glycine dehydrogenase subunit 1